MIPLKSFFRRLRGYRMVILIVLLALLGLMTFKLCRNNPNRAEWSFYMPDDSTFCIHPFSGEDGMTLVIPASWDMSKVMAKIDGKIVKDTLQFPKMKLYRTTAPAFFINTESGTMDEINSSKDKSHKEKAEVLLLTESGNVEYRGRLNTIRGHGNGSWSPTTTNPILRLFASEMKLPYNITFAKACKLLNLHKAKKYCLIANGREYSNARNQVAYMLSRDLNVPNSIGSEYVSLFLNGEYNGLYLLTNKIQLGKHGINVTQIENENVVIGDWEEGFMSPIDSIEGYSMSNKNAMKGGAYSANVGDITGTYLLDHSNHGYGFKRNKSGFVTKRGMMIEIKSPKEATREEVAYILNFYNRLDDALVSSSGCHPTEKWHFSEFLDMKSFAYCYILQELLDNTDGGRGSFYVYKLSDSLGGKLYAGPVWDFDNSLRLRKNDVVYIKTGLANHPEAYPGFLSALCRHEDFMDTVKVLYNEMYPLINTFLTNDDFENFQKFVSKETEIDNLRWPVSSRDNVATLRDLLLHRNHFLYDELVTHQSGNKRYTIFLDMNKPVTTSYYTYEYKIDNDSVFALPLMNDAKSEFEFFGWSDMKGDCVEIVDNSYDGTCIKGNWTKLKYPRLNRLIRKL